MKLFWSNKIFIQKIFSSGSKAAISLTGFCNVWLTAISWLASRGLSKLFTIKLYCGIYSEILKGRVAYLKIKQKMLIKMKLISE